MLCTPDFPVEPKGEIERNTSPLKTLCACMQMTAVPACIAEFKASAESEAVDIVGLVSHAGLAVDRSIAEVATGVDFIVSAHSHTAMFPGQLGECLNFTAGEACVCVSGCFQILWISCSPHVCVYV